MFLIADIIGAHEKKDVGIINLLGAFTTKNMDKESIMVLQERLEELMVKIDTILYQKLLTIDNGSTIFYVWLQKALYRCLMIALMFDENLAKEKE